MSLWAKNNNLSICKRYNVYMQTVVNTFVFHLKINGKRFCNWQQVLLVLYTHTCSWWVQKKSENFEQKKTIDSRYRKKGGKVHFLLGKHPFVNIIQAQHILFFRLEVKWLRDIVGDCVERCVKRRVEFHAIHRQILCIVYVFLFWRLSANRNQ